ncbi:histidinol dehydrogenase [Candidatus Fermentibacteria bacterium]|nr:histidinol dehydrogenase [Candidatus Fermentibacteria bacterium]
MSPALRIFDSPREARAILERRSPDEIVLPSEVQNRLETLFGPGTDAAGAVRRIVRDVRTRGDAALFEWCRTLDGPDAVPVELGRRDFDAAVWRIPPALRDAMEYAAGRIRAYHRARPMSSLLAGDASGILGRLETPLSRVGIYVPGGGAPLFSTLLMSAIPAECAGVGEVIVCTPPSRGGSVPDAVLAAASLSGVSRLFSCGGAQAVAAMAFGTRTIPSVDKIVGPGNIFVTLAKREVFGAVGIDGLHGPSELMVIADSSADPRLLAADLLAQAEHDEMASAVLLTNDSELASRAAIEVEAGLESLPRRKTAEESLRSRGGAVILGSIEEALAVASAFAPEHLQLSVSDPWPLIGMTGPAGAVFVGEKSCEVLGDYVAGPSHTLPTGGTARFSSGLGVGDFLRSTSLVAVSPLDGPAEAAAVMARAEGLEAHARSAEARRGP